MLDNGCVCCSVQTDLVGSLEHLFWSRLQRRIPRFDRVVIETTGIAGPARIVGLFSIDSSGLVAERYALAAVVCTVDGVDGVGGEQQLQQHPESLSQVALADLVLITKTNLAGQVDSAGADRLATTVGRINGLGVIRRGAGGAEAATQMREFLLQRMSNVVEGPVEPEPDLQEAVADDEGGTAAQRHSGTAAQRHSGTTPARTAPSVVQARQRARRRLDDRLAPGQLRRPRGAAVVA